jgi:hypothetical protein
MEKNMQRIKLEIYKFHKNQIKSNKIKKNQIKSDKN